MEEGGDGDEDEDEDEVEDDEVRDDEVEYIESEPAGELPPLSAQHLSYYYSHTLHWDLTLRHSHTAKQHTHTHMLSICHTTSILHSHIGFYYTHTETLSHCGTHTHAHTWSAFVILLHSTHTVLHCIGISHSHCSPTHTQ